MEHACIICKTDISHKRRDALRCNRCLQDRVNEYKRQQREHERKTRVKPIRHCPDCGDEITRMPSNAQRCKTCRKYKLRRYHRNYLKTWRRKQSGPPKPKQCCDCEADITSLNHNAQRCAPCAKIRKREYNKEWQKDNPERMRKLKKDRYHKQGGEGYAKRCNQERLLERDGSVCGICKEPLGDPFNGKETHVDHIKLVSHGGSNDLSNLRLTHAKCNLKRAKPRS